MTFTCITVETCIIIHYLNCICLFFQRFQKEYLKHLKFNHLRQGVVVDSVVVEKGVVVSIDVAGIKDIYSLIHH